MSPSRKPTVHRLTVGEIELLRVLWEVGPATIAEVHAAMPTTIGYTTVQTRLNRLTAKRVASKSKRRPARYKAVLSPDDVNRADLNVLVGHVNDGNVVPLLAHLIRDRSMSSDEIDELRAMIDEAERKSQSAHGDEQ